MSTPSSSHFLKILNSGATSLGQVISQSSNTAQSVVDHLADDPILGRASKLARFTAGKAETIGAYLEQNDIDKMLSDLQILGRERPWVVISGGFLTGLAISRMLKAGLAEPLKREFAPSNMKKLVSGSVN